jgi:hypothetical protein
VDEWQKKHSRPGEGKSTEMKKRCLNIFLFTSLLVLSLSACGGASGPAAQPPGNGRSPTTSMSEVFEEFHLQSESLYDGNGTWGHAKYGYRMALRDSYWRADVYGHLSTKAGRLSTTYGQRADAAIQYLLSAQQQGGSGVFGFPADVNNPEFGDVVRSVIDACPQCIHDTWVISLPGNKIAELYYDHGYALTAVARAYQRTGDAKLLAPIRRAADWIMGKPLTTNINYLSALSKGLCHAYAATQDVRYLHRAVQLHQEGILPGLAASGEALDAHNAKLEYHGFIVSGLIALRQSLPANHAFIAQLEPVLNLAVARMAQRNMTEDARYGVTWPGTNLLAWHELSMYRPLSAEEAAALRRVLSLTSGYLERIQSEQTGFRLQKALYSHFPLGLFVDDQ